MAAIEPYAFPASSSSRVPGDDAVIRKEGKRLIIEPAARKSLLAVLKTLKPLDENFPAIDDSPPEPVEI